MNTILSILPSIITLVVLIITGAYGYGKISQKIDSLSENVKRLDKRIDEIRIQSWNEKQGIESKIEGINQNFIAHLQNHQ